MAADQAEDGAMISRAILCGCRIAPTQIFGFMVDREYYWDCQQNRKRVGLPTGASALGCLCISLGIWWPIEVHDYIPRLKKLCPALFVEPVQCHCGDVFDNLMQMVSHLNDSHEWTREKIAKWLNEQGL